MYGVNYYGGCEYGSTKRDTLKIIGKYIKNAILGTLNVVTNLLTNNDFVVTKTSHSNIVIGTKN